MLGRGDWEWRAKGNSSLTCRVWILNKENVFLVNVFYIAFCDKKQFSGGNLSEWGGGVLTTMHVPEVRGMWGTSLVSEEALVGLSSLIDWDTSYMNKVEAKKEKTVENCCLYLTLLSFFFF